MHPIAHAHLLSGLVELIHDARGDGPGYERLVEIEIAIRAAGDLEFDDALTLLNQLQDGLADEHPTYTGPIGRSIILN